MFANKLKLDHSEFITGMVSATSDGAGVNPCVYNGLLAQLRKDERPWLVSIHCVSHRMELAVTDSMLKQKTFVELKDFMILLYYLFKRSGNLKRLLKNMGIVHDVCINTFPKVHGTRL